LILLLLLAQTEAKPPTKVEVVPGSAVPDSAYHDTLAGGRVDFGADTIIFYSDTKEVLLLGNGKVEYGDITVYSDSIRFSTRRRLLSAYKGARLLSASDSLVGTHMQYAVETHKGVMYEGRTQIEKGYFYGEGVWLVEENTLYITHGYYTTCERDPPHYDFYGSQLKVLLDDMVISRPIFLRVRKIPVLAAPFWYLPIGRDRKSGLLPFKFGHSDAEGWFAKMARYYWVPNDYSDVLFSLDVMTRKGFRPGLKVGWEYGPAGSQYAVGNASADYIYETDTRNQRWNLNLNNTTNIPDGTRLTAAVHFTSDASYILDYIENEDSLTLLLDQRTRSDVALTRKVLGRPVSLSASREDDLVTGSYTMNLPRFSLGWPTLSPFRFFTLSFGSFSVSNIYRHEVTMDADTVQSVEDSRRATFNQPLTLSWGYAFFKVYRFKQSWSAGQGLVWSDDSLARTAGYSLSNTLTTEFYRIFGVYLLGMRGLLHTVSPSVTYLVTPRTAAIDPWVVYPRFDTTLAAHSLSFSVGQTFRTKIRSRSDTTSVRKQNLLDLTTGIGYNLLTDSLTPATASIRLPTGLPIQGNVNMSYDVYTDSFTLSTYVSAGVERIVFPLLGWRGRKPQADTTTPASDTLAAPESDSIPSDTLPVDSHTERETFVERFSRSTLAVEDRWTMNGEHMLSVTTRLYLPLDMELNLSLGSNLSESHEHWQDYIVSSSFSLIKGLHCWEAVLELAPRDGLDNLEWSFYLRIKELPDIEIGRGLLEQLGGG